LRESAGVSGYCRAGETKGVEHVLRFAHAFGSELLDCFGPQRCSLIAAELAAESMLRGSADEAVAAAVEHTDGHAEAFDGRAFPAAAHRARRAYDRREAVAQEVDLAASHPANRVAHRPVVAGADAGEAAVHGNVPGDHANPVQPTLRWPSIRPPRIPSAGALGNSGRRRRRAVRSGRRQPRDEGPPDNVGARAGDVVVAEALQLERRPAVDGLEPLEPGVPERLGLRQRGAARVLDDDVEVDVSRARSASRARRAGARRRVRGTRGRTCLER